MNGLIERVESYLDLVSALPTEAQVGLGLVTALALWMGWKVSKPLRWLLGAGSRLLMRPATRTVLRPIEKEIAGIEASLRSVADFQGNFEAEVDEKLAGFRDQVDTVDDKTAGLRADIERWKNRLIDEIARVETRIDKAPRDTAAAFDRIVFENARARIEAVEAEIRRLKEGEIRQWDDRALNAIAKKVEALEKRAGNAEAPAPSLWRAHEEHGKILRLHREDLDAVKVDSDNLRSDIHDLKSDLDNLRSYTTARLDDIRGEVDRDGLAIAEHREALQQLRDELQVERNMRTPTAPVLTYPEAKRAISEAAAAMNAMEGARGREVPCTQTQAEAYEKRIAVLKEHVREGNEALRRMQAQRDETAGKLAESEQAREETLEALGRTVDRREEEWQTAGMWGQEAKDAHELLDGLGAGIAGTVSDRLFAYLRDISGRNPIALVEALKRAEATRQAHARLDAMEDGQKFAWGGYVRPQTSHNVASGTPVTPISSRSHSQA